MKSPSPLLLLLGGRVAQTEQLQVEGELRTPHWTFMRNKQTFTATEVWGLFVSTA